jgi:hypothetical protein
MKIALLSLFFASATFSVNAGDWGKAPVQDKMPIEECVDLGGMIGVTYGSEYIYKGYMFGGDTAVTHVSYTFDGLALPITIAADYANIIKENPFRNIVNDELALSATVGLPSFAGIDAALSFTERFYSEDPNTALYASRNGEFGLHLEKDLEVALLKFDLFYNLDLPNSWNGSIPTFPNGDSGSWFWDLGLERAIPVFGQDLVLSGGVAYADNYWGTAPNFQNGGRSSGWNHYYLRASLPIELNCRTVLTPYIGYVGAPDTWLLDGAPNWNGLTGQSDVLHGGLNLSVSF